jgi:uncharacterized protein (DUF2141 family)
LHPFRKNSISEIANDAIFAKRAGLTTNYLLWEHEFMTRITKNRRQIQKLAFGLCLLGGVVMASGSAYAADLTLKMTNVRSDDGTLMVALFDTAEGFPKARTKLEQAVPAKIGEVSVTFTDLPPGKYAIAIYHDENGNGEMDKNFFGVPNEGYGFGNNAKGFAGAPSFEASAVEVADKNIETSIELIY